jgi:iron complex outermembrane receptor protein/outer membrane receptor for ferrienterochelin and colicins
MKKIFIALSLLLSAFSLQAQTTIKGSVKGKADQLQGVSVTIPALKKGTVTDSLGNYVLKNIPSGKIKIQFSFTGYEMMDTTIEVGTKEINLSLVLEEKKEALEDVIIVSSSRTNSRIEDLPTKVEVLGAEEVHEENQIKPGNIASLLGDIAGIQIQQTNAATGNADMRIQGLQGKYTQILRDGMPLFGGYSGSFGILQIPPLDLQQIELVKGAASTLYGGGAIAGMLNLVSKKPKLGVGEKSITLNTSTLKENNANVFFSGRNKKMGYTLFAGGTLQKQVDVNNDGFSDVPNIKSTFIHPRFFLYNNPNSTIIIGYTLNYEDRNGGDMQVLNNQKDATHQFFIQNKTFRNTVDVTWENKMKNNGILTAKASISITGRDILTNSYGMKGNETVWYSEVAYSQKLKKHNYVVGVNFNGTNFMKQLPDSTLLPNEANNTIGLFAQDDWKFANKFTLQAGLRTDFNSVYGTFVLPRLSLMYKANNHVTMRLGGGLGYKTPTLFNSEIDERDYRYVVGYAKNIEPEKSYGLNADINYKVKAGGWDLTFNQTFFYNQIDKPILLATLPSILPIPPTPPVYQYQNQTSPLQTAGFETYIAARHDALELYLGYVYTNAKRKYNNTNPNLPLIARNKLATVIAYEFSEHFRAGVEASYTGEQYLDNGTTTTPYVFGAVMMNYKFKKVSFVLNCENLFDYRQNKNNQVVFPPYTNPTFPEIWAPLDGRVVNLSMMLKL